MLDRARRYVHTLRHLRLRQVAGRPVFLVKRRLGVLQGPPPPDGLRGALGPVAPFPQHDPWNRRADLLRGRFRFLSRTAALGQPVDWRAGGTALLWQFHLHAFGYLYRLAPEEQAALCRCWVRVNPPGQGVGWHPYPTARRVVHWCRAGVRAPDLQRSLYRQAAFLFRHVEWHLGGNHLLENARALVVAGRFFEGQGEAPRWLARGLRLYRKETPRQVLGDGGHVERSPMYHALVLEGYLDVLNLLPPAHPERPLLAGAARRMLRFLRALTHPDGGLALFNDSTLEGAPPPEALLRYACGVLGAEEPAPQRRCFAETGYFVQDTSRPSVATGMPDAELQARTETRPGSSLKNQDTSRPSLRKAPARTALHRNDVLATEKQDTSGLYLAIDGGPVGPDHLPAHAHADLFSFELSAGGLRFVVDSGVYEYAAGPMRAYVRSTPAHNTVCVDGVSQAECWSSFRVGRRYRPRDVSCRYAENGCRFEGRFDGYARLLGDGIVHRRVIRMRTASPRRLVVEDTLTGSGVHRVRSYLHLHPAVGVAPGEGQIVLRRRHVSCVLQTAAPFFLEKGWYCPAFGTRRANPVLVMGGTCRLPVRLAYHLSF